MNLYTKKNTKAPFSGIQEKVSAKLLFECIMKTQAQCKTSIAGLKRNRRKSLRGKLLPSNT